MAEILELPKQRIEPLRVEIEIPLGDLPQARRMLECLAATSEAALKVLNGDEDDRAKITAVRQLFDALNLLIRRDCGLISICQFPRIKKDPPDAS